MSHAELNLLLQQCPESPYFARDDFETSEESARKLVLEFVERARFGYHEPLAEASQSQEKQSLASFSVKNESANDSVEQRMIISLQKSLDEDADSAHDIAARQDFYQLD